MIKPLPIAFLLIIVPLTLGAQIENFHIDIGNFFSQGYGNDLNEEATDIAQTLDGFAFTGWQDTVKEETLTKDLVLYFTNSNGKLLNKVVQGSQFFDEIGTGITTTDHDHLAVCEYQTSNFIPSKFSKVYQGDVLRVKYFDLNGNLIWTYTHGGEERGLAPVDIRFFNSHLYVLANEYLGPGAFGVRVLKLNTNGQLLATSPTFSSSTNRIWCSEIEFMNGVLSTIGNDQNAKFPELVSFDPTNLQIVTNVSLSSYPNHFLFGFVMDSVTNNYTAAGYVVDHESDTNALLMHLEPGFNPILVKNLGIIGTEKFRDIGVINDGFIATGVRDNKGLGGYDNYVSHLNVNLDTLMEQTDGGIRNERNTGMIISKDLNSAYLVGHNETYGYVESGNSYVLGVLTKNFANSWGFSCELPRIMFLDKLLDNNNNYSMMPNLDNHQPVINEIASWGVDILFLYDVDYLFATSSITYQDPRVKKLISLIEFAHDTKGITIGFITGPSRDKVINVSEAIDGKIKFNYDFSTKINLVMLEHEFWNAGRVDVNSQNGNRTMALSAPRLSEFNHSTQNPFRFPSGKDLSYNPPYNGNKKANPFTSAAGTFDPIDADAYYRMMIKDHIDMLQAMHDNKTHQANAWKNFDYISYMDNLSNVTASSQVSSYSPKYYQNVYNNNGGPNNDVTIEVFRQEYSLDVRPITNATFLVYYRGLNYTSAGNVDYGLGQGDDYDERLIGLGQPHPTSGMPFRAIPLFSAEDVVCGLADFLGPWLGGSNRPNIAELNYADQFKTDFTPTNAAVANEVRHSATAWFKYTCMTNKSYSLAVNDPFTSIHERINCVPFSPPLGYDKPELSKNKIGLYPNPTNDIVFIEMADQVAGSLLTLEVFASNGNLISKKLYDLEQKTYYDLSKLPNGVYFFTFRNEHEYIQTSRVLKK